MLEAGHKFHEYNEKASEDVTPSLKDLYQYKIGVNSTVMTSLIRPWDPSIISEILEKVIEMTVPELVRLVRLPDHLATFTYRMPNTSTRTSYGT